MRIYFVRHGETQVNQRGVYAGLTDYGLNESGVEQGKRLAKAIGHLPFDVAVASGLRRTRQTAFLIAPDARCEPIEEFNEIAFGEWEDRHYQEIALNDAENYEKWCADWQSVAPPAGESFEHFSARIAQTFSAWLKRAEEASFETVLFVGHQGTLRCILLSLLNMPPGAFWHFTFSHGAYSVVDIHHGHAVVRQLNVDALPHA
ncbi:alpha-ribazole phosphatase [Leminorella grimontii]|uniref:phosphoglycerate mutase (2,3-diphosphoglycerate-dependent) n=1 Tax=Leminorella grimontii TaxID=82981 RepID=A0AAV5MX76_9GAMM|nr:histidine phosphatase family protein [Leminorella grimontii]KFC96380.1 alpha-ribazole-5'-phosphate phosphatase [Leminorella grimontii ATCC 33999 = DSM 5078]GKX54431.1 alpha-ribazole phosphatase [Leminorella grimontii]